MPRETFGQDLLYSLGSALTVCQIQRNNAEARIRAVLEGKQDKAIAVTGSTADPTDASTPPLELDTFARDQIRAFIERRFKGHELARLVAAILNAQGYQTHTSPLGPDGGVDILAGRGPMGFDEPRVVVQVKSSSQPVDVSVPRELKGVLHDHGARQGLLVSWGGFRQSVINERRRMFFEVRLWDAGDLITALLDCYDQLPEDLRAELPLKRVWMLVPEEA